PPLARRSSRLLRCISVLRSGRRALDARRSGRSGHAPFGGREGSPRRRGVRDPSILPLLDRETRREMESLRSGEARSERGGTAGTTPRRALDARTVRGEPRLARGCAAGDAARGRLRGVECWSSRSGSRPRLGAGVADPAAIARHIGASGNPRIRGTISAMAIARDAIVVRWAFVRGLALVWFVAFASLAVQIDGLAGRDGILPAAEYLAAAHKALGSAAIARVPTLCWWLGAEDATLTAMCAAGEVLALLLAFGAFPGLVSLLLWALHLSLPGAGP